MPDTDALGLVESTSERRFEFTPLINAACRTLELIEPWNSATSENPIVNCIIQKVNTQGVAYARALGTSIKTAQEGYMFCFDADVLCDALLEPIFTIEEVQELIQGMREVARRAHEAAKSLSEDFGLVRRNLNEITRGIPAKVTNLRAMEQHALKLKDAAGKNSSQARDIGNMFKGAALATGIAFPPNLVIFPIALCVSAIISSTMETRYIKEAAKRTTEARSCADAMTQLAKVSTDLSELGRHIDLFADWWLGMDTMLSAVEARVSCLGPEKPSKVRIKSIKKGWSEIRHSYVLYSTKITRLQSLYPLTDRIPSERLIEAAE